MAWVNLLKSYYTSSGKKIPVGHKVNVSRAKYKELMRTKGAEDYNGTLPPKKKQKTNFFKQQ
jgi:hypothetical protein